MYVVSSRLTRSHAQAGLSRDSRELQLRPSGPEPAFEGEPPVEILLVNGPASDPALPLAAR